MPGGKFGAVVRRQPGAVIIDLSGDINTAAESGLDAAYTEAEKDKPPVIMLNFRGTDYINSTGIALIVGLLRRAQAAHRRLMVFGLTEHYASLFNITRLSDYVDIFPDEASALTTSTGVPQSGS